MTEWLQRLALIVAAALCASPGAGQCRFPTDLGPPTDGAGEVERIRKLLDACQRGRKDNEQLFFTWGHRDKLEWLKVRPAMESCEYNKARETAREQLYLARLYQGNRSDYVELRGLADRVAHTAPQNLWEIHHGQWAFLGERRKDVLLLAMIEFTYPDFERFVLTEPKVRVQELLKRLETKPNRVEKAKIAGELVSLNSKLSSAEGTRPPSSSSYGYGVYLSNDPLAYLSHFESEQHGGLVCRFGVNGAPSLKVVDLTDPSVLKAFQFYPQVGQETEQGQGNTRPLGVMVQPESIMGLSGYNSYIHPRAFDDASHNRLLAIRKGGETIYLDRCAVDYGRGGSCDWFQVSDLTCEQAARLSEHAKLGSMQAYFKKVDPRRDFLNKLKDRCPGVPDLYRADASENPG